MLVSVFDAVFKSSSCVHFIYCMLPPEKEGHCSAGLSVTIESNLRSKWQLSRLSSRIEYKQR